MIKVDKKVLLEGLKKAIKVVPRSTTLSVLQGVLVECSNNNMALTTTDLNMAMTTNIICQTEMFDENYLVDAKLFHNIINKMPSGEIEITFKEKNLEIKNGKSKFNINTLGEPSEFPNFKTELNNIETITLPGEIFKEIVAKTIPFTSKDETRPILNGVLFEFKNNEVKGVSLDGYRLAHYIAEIDNDIEKNIVVPSETLLNISNVVEGDVFISFDKDRIKSLKFETGNTIIYTRILEGQFLNYKGILKVNNAKNTVRINVEKFKNAIERVNVVSKSSNVSLVPVILTIDTNTNKLIIEANADIANIKEEIDIDIEGEDIKIAFNPIFLLEGLKAINSENEKIEIRINSNLEPVYVLDGENFIYLVLPIRLASYEKAS